MATKKQVAETFVSVLAQIIEKPEAEVAANPGASFKEDYGMTSLQYFPLISEMEEKFDIEMDYSGFLLKALTVQDGIDFVYETVKG